ncbi:MAG: hypothetical protein ACKPKO_24595, partial [Candidatus Fonsibacter sp.]
KYNGAVRFWRRVMVSECFRELRPALTELLAAASTQPDSKWKIIVSMGIQPSLYKGKTGTQRGTSDGAQK